MNKKENKQWLRLVIHLKKTFPVGEPVHVRTMPLSCKYKEAWGTAWFNPEINEFEVKISAKILFDVRVHALVHEWAHVITWHKIYNRCLRRMKMENFHSKEWGIAHAQIYRKMQEFNWGRD